MKTLHMSSASNSFSKRNKLNNSRVILMAPVLLSFTDLGSGQTQKMYLLFSVMEPPHLSFILELVGGLKNIVSQGHPRGSPLTGNLNVPSVP